MYYLYHSTKNLVTINIINITIQVFTNITSILNYKRINYSYVYLNLLILENTGYTIQLQESVKSQSSVLLFFFFTEKRPFENCFV